MERAGYYIHQRALSRSVLADERVNLSRFQFKIDAVERHCRPESFADR